MNIAIFTDTYTPIKNGVVTVVTSEKKALEDIGHKVVIFTVDVPGYEDSEQNVYRFSSVKPVGIETEQRFTFVDNKKVYSAIREHKIDIIHNHTEFSLGFAAFKAAKHFNIPVVMTTHTAWEDYYRHYLKLLGYIIPRSLVRKIITYTTKKADCLICPSQKIKDYYKSIIETTPSVLIQNAIIEDDFKKNPLSENDLNEIRRSYNIKSDDVVGLFVGRVSEEKRVTLLISEVIKAFKKSQKGKFIMVGDGEPLKNLKKMVSDNNMEDRFIFTGFMPWKDVYKAYAVADYFATASLTEICSMTELEALFSAKPIVASNDPSISDKLYHGQNGYLAVNDDDLSKYILEIEKSKETREKFGAYSLQVSKKFTMDTHIKKLTALYKYVIKNHNKNFNEKEISDLIENY